MNVIESLEKSETVISQWKLRSDGSLELPAGLMHSRANYLLKVCNSDGNCVKIPVRVAPCVSDDEHAPLQPGEL